MPDSTRFTSGVNTAMPDDALGNYPMIDPFHSSGTQAPVSATNNIGYGVAEYKNDFHVMAATEYTLTGTGTPSFAVTNGAGGIALLSTSIGASDSAVAIMPTLNHQYVAGQNAWYSTTINLSDATTCALVAGLKDAVSESNGIWFSKASASTSVLLNIKVATVAITPIAITTAANATMIELAWYYNGADLLVYANDVFIARVLYASLPTVVMAPIYSLTNGSGVIRTLSIDYILAAEELAR
jgi:hypothetical protein